LISIIVFDSKAIAAKRETWRRR